MNITVYGAGYVGLVAAACFSKVGIQVLTVDPDPARLAALSEGRVPFLEPGLDELVTSGIAAGTLRFTGDPEAAAAQSEIHFLAVGTPSAPDGSTDESQLHDAAHAIGRGATSDVIVVIKSTAPAGAAKRVAEAVLSELSARGAEHRVDVIVNPEFLRAGSAVTDFLNPDRVVIGGDNTDAISKVRELYLPFATPEQIFTMDAASASLVKYAANAMLATRISFMNELANLSEALGADIEGVRRGLGADPRIGDQYLSPGLGYGGSCLPKDVASLIAVGEAEGVTMGVARAVAEANSLQPHRISEKLERRLGDLADKTIALWGIAFKGGTDDLRDAPSKILIDDLLTAGARIRAFDPGAAGVARRVYQNVSGVEIVESAEAALQGSNALAIAADWPEFRAVAPSTMLAALVTPLVVDGRNLFDPAEMRAAGLTYCGVGRGDA